MRLDLGIADRLVPWHDKMASITPLHQTGQGFYACFRNKTAANTVFVVLAKMKRSIGGKPERFRIVRHTNGSGQDSALPDSPLCFLHLCWRITR